MKLSFASLFTKFTLATAVAGTLAGCDEPEYATPSPVTTSSVGQAQVLIVNASPGTQGVTITRDNAAFGMALPYLGMSTTRSYTAMPAGQRLFIYNDPANIPATPTTAPAGTPPITTARSLVSRTSYLGGTSYTIFLTDAPTRAYAFPVTSSSDQGGIRSITLTDNLNAPAAGNAKIRFVNLSPSGTYGIYNSVTMASLFSAVPNRAYRATTNTSTAMPPVTTNFANFTEVAAGSYTLDVRSTATTPIVGTQQVFTLAAGKIYTFYTRGIANNTTTPLGISVVEHN
ncbi:hypothetical protein GCM10023185_16460 [Hymenobacter saemangeumensis]|uniref:DUF4397 domain-containing protein n=1 Tax=Hymenobacter saemangeumensis TaxID=1084522 RepID=A0ABP8IA21_9BACT